MAQIDEFSDVIGDETPPVARVPLARQESYEGGERFSREMALWSPPIQSADAEIMPSKGISDARVRDSLRNDAYVRHGAQIQKDTIVGSKFLLNAKPNLRVLGLDETWATEFQAEVEAKFTLYSESHRAWPDAARKLTLTEMVRLAVGVYAMSGEVLASVEWMRSRARPFSTALQFIDLDRLSNPNNEMNTRELCGGVKRDRFGAPLGYWIREAHPGDLLDEGNWQWRFIPATRGQVVGNDGWDRPQMIHIIDQQRPDQTRGISQMVAALKEMRMTKKFRDTVLQSAVLNASYAASIESDLPADVALQQAGGGDPHAISSYAEEYLSQVARYTRSGSNMHIDGTRVPVFYPGTKMNLQPAGTPGGVGTEFEASMLRYISASLGVSYEQLSKDFSKANYSNLRASLADTQRRAQVVKRSVADRFATLFYRLWLEEALNKGEITSMPRSAPNWYDGLNQEAYSACTWIGASLGQIDELKETQAAVLRMKNGLSTHEDELAKLGKDWREVYAQLEREAELEQEHSLNLSGDPAMTNAASGTPTDTGKDPDSVEPDDQGQDDEGNDDDE